MFAKSCYNFKGKLNVFLNLKTCIVSMHLSLHNMSDRSAAPMKKAVLKPAPRKRIDVRTLRPATSSFTVAVSERHHEGVWHST